MRSKQFKFIIHESGVNFYVWDRIEDGFVNAPFVKEYCGAPLRSCVMLMENGGGHWAVKPREWADLGAGLNRKIVKGKFPIKRLVSEHHRYGKQIFALSDSLEKRGARKFSNQQMARLLKQLWKAYANLSGVGLIPVVSDFEHSQLSDLLVGVLRDRRVNADLRQDYLSTLISLNQPTLFWREQLELLRLCRRFKSQQPLFVSPEFARYVKKYFWLNYGYEGPVWQEEDFKERTLWIFNNKDTISAQLKTHELRLINLRREQWELERRLGLSRRELFMFAVARQFMYLKAYRTEARHRFNWASDELFREAGEKLGVSITDFHYATIEEIATLLMGQPVDRSEIKERSRRLLHITEDGRRGNMIKSDKIDDFLSRHIMKDKEDKVVQTSQLLTGQVAFKGKVTGKVKIVTGPKDILKVEAGDVLVALTTNPDVLPAMKKAAAFVTDVGGITSHAAIVAREMEKPCVIGTKIATRVLKDGDIVEVDATHGIIRIIKN